MPIPYQARVDIRRFLNYPGFHGGAYIVAYVEDTSGRVASTYPPQPRLILEIADCSNRINLEFDVHSDEHLENSLHKLDALIKTLEEFGLGLIAEAELYRERLGPSAT